MEGTVMSTVAQRIANRENAHRSTVPSRTSTGSMCKGALRTVWLPSGKVPQPSHSPRPYGPVRPYGPHGIQLARMGSDP